MKIVAGCPVRNRAWILPEYLPALEATMRFATRYGWNDSAGYLFLENDSTDETLSGLNVWAWKRPDIKIATRSGGYIPGEGREEYGAYGYAHLADVRNTFIDLFLAGDGDYLFSVDSDVIVKVDTLLKLVAHADQNTIVGAAICNIPGQQLDGQAPGNFMVRVSPGALGHPLPYSTVGTFNVDVIGAVYLIPRRVLEAGVRYAPHPQGEDIPFCVDAAKKQFEMKIVMDAQCDHIMIKNERRS